MDAGLSRVHELGHSLGDVEDCLRRIPLRAQMARAIHWLAQIPECEVHIVSDANSFFIDTILAAHGLSSCITSIHSNPAEVGTSGALRVRPYHPANAPPHGCSTCWRQPNMCKGLILDKLRDERLPSTCGRVIYLGDGGGDFCPSLRLTKADFVLARTRYPLSMLLNDAGKDVDATVLEWESAADVEVLLRRLFDTVE
eukprot:TRINITY_DN17635_c0_g1_i2.p1 TRINITY_DN17635_c0_g1~~TRINITY_DN17635_c0_g1_i2.p1  ORF type:complete len:198 (+),score=23.11 TRINITY_DN17635_c0_g1_i2:426-1019(+)